MAQNTSKTVTGGAWTQLTDANVTSITFQNNGGHEVYIAGTTSAVAPTNLDTAIKYNPGTGERNIRLSDLYPGIAAVRVYAFAYNNVRVFVSHA